MDKCLLDKNLEEKILNKRIEAQKKYKIQSTPTIFINENKYENQETDLNEEVNNQKIEEKIIVETSDEIKNENNKSSHQVIHKKEGRLHIYVRQDKYKGELKSKNWVGRLYIDGKQKISSSGTTNLDEAIQILEKWFDDVQDESERLKNENNLTKNINQEATDTLTNNQICLLYTSPSPRDRG